MEALRDLLGEGSLEAKGELAAEDVADEWAVGLEGLPDVSRAVFALGFAGLVVVVVELDGWLLLASASPLPAAAVANLSMIDRGWKDERNEGSN
jgi:hypothetical protein